MANTACLLTSFPGARTVKAREGSARASLKPRVSMPRFREDRLEFMLIAS